MKAHLFGLEWGCGAYRHGFKRCYKYSHSLTNELV